MPAKKTSKLNSSHKAEYKKMMGRDMLMLSVLLGGLFVIGMIMYNMQLLPFQERSQAYVLPGVSAWATKVEWGTKVGTNQQGGVYKPAAGRSNPAFGTKAANFEPENPKDPNVANGKFVSMGYGGELVYSFGRVVQNASGFDITIHEASVGDRSALTEDVVEVEVSQDRSVWKKLGNASSRNNDGGQGIKKFDIASTGWDWIGYVKLRDISDRSKGKSYDDGFDLDAIGVVKLGSAVTPAPNSLGTTQLNEKRLKVMTFNVLNGHSGFCTGSGVTSSADKLAQYIVNNAYDIVYLQESGCNDRFAQHLQDKLRGSSLSPSRLYYARIKYLADDKEIAIYSRYPLENAPVNSATVSDVSKPIEVIEDSHAYEEIGLKRKIMNVVANIEGRRIRLIGVHPSSKGRGCSEIEGVTKNYVSGFTDLPIMMAGDYNCDTRSMISNSTPWLVSNYRTSCYNSNYLTDLACGDSTGKNDWNSSTGPIDHISTSINLGNSHKITNLINAKVIRDEVLDISDHWPVSAEIVIK